MKNLIIAMIVMAVLALASVAAAPQFGAQAPLVSVSGSDITITGNVIDAGEGANVELFCNSHKVGDYPVIDGSYTIATVYGGSGCNPGVAVLKLGEAEAVVNIPSYNFVIVPKGGSNNDQPENYGLAFGLQTDLTDSQVPEFSIMTMGLAVIGVGLGLAFLRKK